MTHFFRYSSAGGLRRRRSTPSVYKAFKRVRGPAATQATEPSNFVKSQIHGM